MLSIKVTDEKKFKKVIDVDLSNAGKSIYRGAFDGNILVQLKKGEEIESDGQHGVYDWEDEYGFIIIEK